MLNINEESIVNDIACIWNCKDASEISLISENVAVRQFHKNDIIYHESEQPALMLYLVSGKVKVVKECSIGKAQIVRAVKEHTFLGYRAFFAGECYTTSAMAFEDSVVAAIPFFVVTRLMAGNGSIARYFLSQLALILGMTDGRIVSLTQKHIRGRLAETILNLKNNYGVERDGQTLCISMNREDLASMSNMSTSNAIRTLSSFAGDGILSVDGRRIRILDEESLERISNMG